MHDPVTIQREVLSEETFSYISTTDDKRVLRVIAPREGETQTEYRKRLAKYERRRLKREGDPNYLAILREKARERVAKEPKWQRDKRLKELRERARKERDRYEKGVIKPKKPRKPRKQKPYSELSEEQKERLRARQRKAYQSKTMEERRALMAKKRKAMKAKQDLAT